jgi:hypothetical protein
MTMPQWTITQFPAADRLIIAGISALAVRGTVEAGQGQVARGQLLIAKRTNGKFVKFAQTAVTGETLGSTDATNTTYNFTTAQKPILPLSLVVTVTAGANTWTFYDNGDGSLVAGPTPTPLAVGHVWYDNGRIQLIFAAAPGAGSATASYSYAGTAQVDPWRIGIAGDSVDATAADMTASVYVLGAFALAAVQPDVSNLGWFIRWARRLGIQLL